MALAENLGAILSDQFLSNLGDLPRCAPEVTGSWFGKIKIDAN